MIEEGKKVKVHYTLKVDGEVVDQSKEKPLEFTYGEGSVIPGFSEAVKGMTEGEKKEFKVDPEKGYGQVDPSAVVKVPREKFPKEQEIKEGMVFTTQSQEGQPLHGRVVGIEEQEVTLDFNHLLAGKELVFDVEVVEVS